MKPIVKIALGFIYRSCNRIYWNIFCSTKKFAAEVREGSERVS